MDIKVLHKTCALLKTYPCARNRLNFMLFTNPDIRSSSLAGSRAFMRELAMSDLGTNCHFENDSFQ